MEEDEEDYGALIYRESQLRKAEAAAMAAETAKKGAKKKKESADASSTRRRATSTRAVSAAVRSKSSMHSLQSKNASKRKRKSMEDDELARKRAKWRKAKQKRKCSTDGCKNSCQRRSMRQAWSKGKTMQQ